MPSDAFDELVRDGRALDFIGLAVDRLASKGLDFWDDYTEAEQISWLKSISKHITSKRVIKILQTLNKKNEETV